jgi:endonuclease/exonuclease/phosphatase family metal-dependent hydrolase
MTATASSGGVRFATFNIRHGRGLDEKVDLDRTVSVIRGIGAKVIGLQELDRGWDRSGGVDQAAALGKSLGMAVAFHPTFSRESSGYGLALATEEEVPTWFQRLPTPPGVEPRGVVGSRCFGVSVLVTHLSQTREVRRPQIEALARMVEEIEPPVVLMGDLNQGRWGLGPLRRAGLSSPRRRVPTSPAPLPYRQIDLILAGRGARVRSITAHPTRASDHLPLSGLVYR